MGTNSLLLSALLLLTVVTIAVTFSKKMGLGSILGLLLAGIVVGPHSPGPVITQNVDTVRHFTEFGVVLLLFLIGLEMQPRKLWEMRRDVFGLGMAQISLSAFIIFAYILFYAQSWQSAMLIGFTFALSSTAFVMQILQEKGEVATRYGQSSFAILLMQDLAIVPLLAMVPIIADKGTLSSSHPIWQQVVIAIGMVAMVILLGRYIIPVMLERLARERNQEAFIFLVMLSVFVSAWAMESVGLSMALGAFLMGMMLSESRFHLQVQAHIEPYKGLLMSLFFVAVGMSIDLPALSENPLIIMQHLLVIMGIKTVVLMFLVPLFGYSKAIGIKVAFLLSQSGEFGFVLFGAAKAVGVVSDEMFVVGISVISFSMLITPLVVKLGEKLSKRYEKEGEDTILKEGIHSDSARVIIAGYGRIGHIVSSMLSECNVEFAAYDTDIDRVKLGQREGRSVYYGDMSDYGFLTHIDLSKVKMVVVTIDNHHGAARIVSHIKNTYPEMTIFARSKDARAKEMLLHHGASWVLPEAVEGGLRLGEEVLFHMEVDKVAIDGVLGAFRAQDYNGIKIFHEELLKGK